VWSFILSEMTSAATTPPKPPARRRRTRRFVLLVAVATVAFLALVAKVVFDWPASPDPVPWVVQHAAAGRPDMVGRADVWDCWDNFIDSEHYWQVEVKAELVPAIVGNCGVVEPPAPSELPSAFWGPRPYWWRPPRAGGRYFATPGFPTNGRGPDGQFYLMAYDEERGVLYAWHKNNF
jgi:hypothetical protein